MTDELLTPSQRAREAAEALRRGIGGKYDREHTRALQAFARFERDLTAETRETALREALEAILRFDDEGWLADTFAEGGQCKSHELGEALDAARAALAGGEG